MKPGIVFTSLTRNPRPGVPSARCSSRKKSTRAIASHRHASNARTASCARPPRSARASSGAGASSCAVFVLRTCRRRSRTRRRGRSRPGRTPRAGRRRAPRPRSPARRSPLRRCPLVEAERERRARRRSSARSCAFETPTDEPRFAGFTKHGYPSSASTRSANATPSWPSRNDADAATRKPHAANARFIITLSIPTAEPTTPAPTYGRSASSSSPCTVPSSPYGPCRSGSTTSTSSAGPHRVVAARAVLARATVPRSDTGSPSTSSARRQRRRAAPRSARRAVVGEQPSPVGRDRDRDDLVARPGRARCATATAVTRETSCSAERPPKSSSTRMRCDGLDGLITTSPGTPPGCRDP